MKYYNLGDRKHSVSFGKAVIEGIAPDRSLYFPERIPKLDQKTIEQLEHIELIDVATELMSQFAAPELSYSEIRDILEKTLDFEFPLQPIGDFYSLELFHGPTLAFKDVGARFMAQSLGILAQKQGWKTTTTVLVATSGDTGGAVANGFLGVEGIEVVILYPEGKVSEVQELQMTTLGNNITALAVQGNFDDCQLMVKKAFVDTDITKLRRLTSANSINVARWLPQMLYYIAAYQNLRTLGDKRLPVFSVPSGNFGNICAGLMARSIGLPVSRFIAATNVNDTVVRFLNDMGYQPNPTVPTLSNAMDVSDPSNFVRIEELFKTHSLSGVLSAYRFDDNETLEAIRELFSNYNYLADPHGAIGYLGLKSGQINPETEAGIFLETAHPVKFDNAVNEAIQQSIPVPESIASLYGKKKMNQKIGSYSELKELLSSN